MSKYIGTKSGLAGPVPEQVIESKPDFRDYDQGGQYHNAYVTWFNKHIASLPSLPCEWWTPEEGKVYTEGKDFVKQHQRYNTHFTNDGWINCSKDDYDQEEPDSRRIVAVPAAPQEGAQEMGQTLKEFDAYFDALVTNHLQKDAGNLWTAFTDKWNTFKKSLLQQPAPAAVNDEGEGSEDWQNVIVNRINHFINIYHKYEAAELHNALSSIIRLVPPSSFKQSAKTYPAEFVEWAAKYNRWIVEENEWLADDGKTYTTAELYQEWKRIKEQGTVTP